MYRVTLDTNILISATISKGNEFEIFRLGKLGKIKIVISPAILQEFYLVISRPKFGFSFLQTELSFKQLLTFSGVIVPTVSILSVKQDPSDNKILECAISGKVDFIISGDHHLIELNAFKGIPIITSSEFLERLKKNFLVF